jgi:hypothetical protein
MYFKISLQLNEETLLLVYDKHPSWQAQIIRSGVHLS